MSRTNISPAADDTSALHNLIEERVARCLRLIEAGVTIIDPLTTYLGSGVEIGAGSVIRPNTTIDATLTGERCMIGPNAVISDSRVGDGVSILSSVIEGATLDSGVEVGPFCHLRPGTHLEQGVHIGNFVEIKAAHVGAGTKIGHFCYIGDARIGNDVNIGAGTVTCNYDGGAKHETVVEDGAFIGSDTMLVAPVRVGRGAMTGAGSVVTEDVPDGEKVMGSPARAKNGGGTRRRVRTRLG